MRTVGAGWGVAVMLSERRWKGAVVTRVQDVNLIRWLPPEVWAGIRWQGEEADFGLC